MVTIRGAAQEGDSGVINCIKTPKPPKTKRSTDRFGGPALASHGIYVRGKVG